MKIYVDESFIGGYTTISAILISNDKVRLASAAIKRILNKKSIYQESELKKSIIRRDYKDKSIHKSIAKVIKVKSDRLKFSRKPVKQHTPEFYEMYSQFLRSLTIEFPNIPIIIDKFSGFEKIDNYEKYTFSKSINILGLQLADIAIDNYSIDLEYS